jgi:hypothetical protein
VRARVTKAVSKSGTSRISTGSSSTATVPRLYGDGPTTLRPPTIRPMNRLPVSPMNTDAGWKLNTRKPASAPASVAASHAPCGLPSSRKK